MTETFKKDFVIHAKTPIGWGKLKGKPHSAYLDSRNSSYATWIIDQGPDFRYADSRAFILANMSDVVRELTPSQFEHLANVEREMTEQEEKGYRHFDAFLEKYYSEMRKVREVQRPT
jgi:hypothetical protein